MRQRSDPIFAEMLDRIRVGTPNDNDIDMLGLRLIQCSLNLEKFDLTVEQYGIISQSNNNVLCLFPKVTSTEQTNIKLTAKLNIKTTNI